MVSLGGRIAEQLIFDDITTSASSDIKEGNQAGQENGDPLRYVRQYRCCLL